MYWIFVEPTLRWLSNLFEDRGLLTSPALMQAVTQEREQSMFLDLSSLGLEWVDVATWYSGGGSKQDSLYVGWVSPEGKELADRINTYRKKAIPAKGPTRAGTCWRTNLMLKEVLSKMPYADVFGNP